MSIFSTSSFNAFGRRSNAFNSSMPCEEQEFTDSRKFGIHPQKFNDERHEVEDAVRTESRR